jgi:hypothetical protein
MLYTLFIDESGDHTMHRCDDFRYRFLCLTGVLIRRDHERNLIRPEMHAFKLWHLGAAWPILHRSDILNATKGFEALADDEKRNAFNCDLQKHLTKWRYKVWSVCIDKKAHRDKYKAWHHEPYHYCLEVLLERVATFLNRFEHQADVIVEARNKKPDRQLKECYGRIYVNGTEFADASKYQTVFTNRELKIAPKDGNIAGLQIADLIAHPSRSEIMADNGVLNDDGTAFALAPFAKNMCAVISPKYDQWRDKIYGKKFLPGV